MAISAKQAAHQPNLKLAFDIEKPIKIGFLLKQGKTLKKFKSRFFVLYKNYLVYYDEDTKWQFDKTVGNLGVGRHHDRKGMALLLTISFFRVATVP